MALKGEIFEAVSADLADDASLTVRPSGAGAEVWVDTIVHSTGGTDVTQLEVYMVNAGGTDLVMNGDEFPQLNYKKGIAYIGQRISYTNYLTVKNVSGDAKLFVGAFGIVTHDAD